MNIPSPNCVEFCSKSSNLAIVYPKLFYYMVLTRWDHHATSVAGIVIPTTSFGAFRVNIRKLPDQVLIKSEFGSASLNIELLVSPLQK